MKKTCFTVASVNYKPYIKALAASIAETNPDVLFFALLIDRKTKDNIAKADEILCYTYWLEDIVEQDWLKKVRSLYTPFELCNATKVYGHRIARDKVGADTWLYLDSDILILSSLSPVFEEAKDASIILYPHANTAMPSSGSLSQELDWLRYGTYNGGTVLCRKGSETDKFLSWFEERLKFFSLDRHDGIYVDQKWLDLVPALFSQVAISRLKQFNVAYWNFHERTLSMNEDGVICVDQIPVIAYHFSKWKFANPNIVMGSSRYKDPKVWDVLANKYKQALIKAGIDPSGNLPMYSDYCSTANKLQRREWQKRIMFLDSVGRQKQKGGSLQELFKFLLKEIIENTKYIFKNIALFVDVLKSFIRF